jgi:hypothetical protein
MLLAYYAPSHFSSENPSVNRVKVLLVILNTNILNILSDIILITTLPLTVIQVTKSFCRLDISLRLGA